MGKSSLIQRRRQDQGFKWARIAMAALASIGIIDTGSITLNKWGWLGSIACPGGSQGCDKVLDSPWGTIFIINDLSIPLSFIGFISYLAILIMATIPLILNLSKNKNNLYRQTWIGLFFTSCTMGIFSLILLGLMIFKIKAICFFCILSAFISISLLILTFIGGGWDDPSKLLFQGIILSIAVLLGSLIWISSVDPSKAPLVANNIGVAPIVQTKSNSSQIQLAKYLKDNSVVMYSAYWCPHCHDQKELFGKEAAKELTIIECAEDGQNNQSELCDSKGVTGFPSWEINNELEAGIHSLEELASKTGFKGQSDF